MGLVLLADRGPGYASFVDLSLPRLRTLDYYRIFLFSRNLSAAECDYDTFTGGPTLDFKLAFFTPFVCFEMRIYPST